MDLSGKRILILGGAGLVGQAVARKILPLEPERLIIGSLRQHEAEAAVEELEPLAGSTALEPAWGDLFVPEADRDLPRAQLLAQADRRARMLDDLFGELTREVVRRSALGALLLRARPEILVDCINTAGALAYQNVFASAADLRRSALAGGAGLDDVERHLATLYLPQLIRHTQISLAAMREVGTRIYVKVGTSGTGGMGLNIPFTHSEERPSRVLLAKAGLAGAQTLLLYLMARTPGGPAVKEIKPTAAITWKSIGYGPIRRGGRPIERVDQVEPVSIADAFASSAGDGVQAVDGVLTGVYMDAGENGLFTLEEFVALTSLGLMEYVTPQEIAQNVVREIQGHPSGRDVVSALDGATMGPTYRAGVLRAAALSRMVNLEEEHGERAIAYEMLGPPRLSKLLFEAAILGRLHQSMRDACDLDPDEIARRTGALLLEDADLRQRVLSIGLAVLMPDGAHVLRGREVKAPPESGLGGLDERAVERGWVDLRARNWTRWRERARGIVAYLSAQPSVDHGSSADHELPHRDDRIRPGEVVAWILRTEEQGERIKR